MPQDMNTTHTHGDDTIATTTPHATELAECLAVAAPLPETSRDEPTTNYRFRVQPLLGNAEPGFQLTVGMSEEKDSEMIPAHLSAFARRYALQRAHPTEAAVQLELTGLLEWLRTRPGRWS